MRVTRRGSVAQALLDKGLVERAGRGRLRFVLEGFKEYVLRRKGVGLTAPRRSRAAVLRDRGPQRVRAVGMGSD